MKRFIFLGCLIGVITVNSSAQGIDYGGALDAAIMFFDANRCGPDAGKDNAFSWRGACHTSDAVTGGYHDAGDHVKFGLPQCWSAAIMGWAYFEYPSVFEPRKDKFFKMMKWFTDYFLKSHSPGSFVYQVGDGNGDHGYWGSPEQQGGGNRPVIKAPPGSDVCGEAAAALALMYLNYKSIDESYAQQCLEAAKDLQSMAVANAGSAATGRCSDGSGGNFYKSSSHYDDVIWASIWLYYATDDAKYLDKVDEWILIKNDYGDDPFKKKWSPAWDDVTMFNLIKLAEITGNDTYYQGLVFNLEWFKNDLKRSPGGLPIVDTWAPLRYASCEAGLGYSAWRLLGYDSLNELGTFIINYCLGKNPENRSYLTGWGNNPPKHPHHRANEPQRGGSTNGIIGALVGGPTDDSYEDNVNNYTETEVALDYNASFIFGLAAHMYYAAGGKCKNRSPSIKIASPLNGVAVPEGASMEVKVVAEDADGAVTKIDLYQGEKLLGSSPTSPFVYKLEPGTGEVSLKAVATDDSGKVSNAAVTITYIPPCKTGEMLVHTGWVATASSSSQNAGEDPSSALDGKPDTRWGSGGAMSQGMWYQIDMGYPRDVDQVIIDGTGSGSDFPKRLKVYASNDTATLGEPVATVDSGALLQTVTFTKPVTAQYIRLVCEEGQGGSWWSIHEINIPCAGSPVNQNPVQRYAPQAVSFSFSAVAHDGSVLVNYRIPERGRVTIEEYVLNGSRTSTLFDGIRIAGEYTFTRNIATTGSKVILYKVTYGKSTQMKKVIMVR